jgi:uncharacterized membrane protein
MSLADLLQSRTSLPNLHPALVHFPIALLVTALGLDVAVVTLRRWRWLDPAAATHWALGALLAGPAYLAGRAAADSLVLPPELEPHVAAHADWALRLLVVFGALAVARVAVAVRDRRAERTPVGPARLALLGVALLGQWLIVETADHGGALVFTHGVAVRARAVAPALEPSAVTPPPSVTADPEAHPPEAREAHEAHARPPQAPPPAAPAPREGSPATDEDDLERLPDGRVTWRPSATARVPGAGVSLLDGSAAAVRVVGPAPAGGVVLQVDGRALLALPGERGDAAVTLRADLSSFRGTVGLVHHAENAENAEWLAVETTGQVALVRRQEGTSRDLAREPVSLPEGAAAWTVTATGRHLKGKLGDATVIHGHAGERPPGRAGLLVDGHGTLVVEWLDVRPLSAP